MSSLSRFLYFQNVQDQSLTQRAKDLKQTGNDLLKGARDDEKQLQGNQQHSYIFWVKINQKSLH